MDVSIYKDTTKNSLILTLALDVRNNIEANDGSSEEPDRR